MCRDACMTSEGTTFALRITGAVIGLFLIASSVTCFFSACFVSSVSAFIRNFHTGLFGCLVLLAELRWDFLLNGVSFLKSFVGRGILYMYLATIVGTVISNQTDFLYIILTAVLFVIGAMNMFLGCCFRQVGATDKTGPPSKAASPVQARSPKLVVADDSV
uniref:COPI associated protein n=1 Tax=Spongospora subterranea TaxID=70186 RepID=A0A0H5RDE8_9EUKA|eukprot:CRZ12028.1 hypothetical protein [Spongospora subterranea]